MSVDKKLQSKALRAAAKLLDTPWKFEPDIAHFKYKNFHCLIIRNSAASGHLCGYVALPTGHALHGTGYDDIKIYVHGGLTFADNKVLDPESLSEAFIFTTKYARFRPENIPPAAIKLLKDNSFWWIGFDCNHSCDYAPYASQTNWGQRPASYKTVEFVTAELKQLIRQITYAHAPRKL